MCTSIVKKAVFSLVLTKVHLYIGFYFTIHFHDKVDFYKLKFIQ